MHDPPQTSSRPLISITPRKKSVRFNITAPSPRTAPPTNPRTHPLNVSYTIPSATVNIDHVTQESHLQHLNDHVEYIPTARRNRLEVTGERIQPAPPQTLDDLHRFMRSKAQNLRQNMTKVTSTFHEASTHLNRLKEEREIIAQRPSRIPISTRRRSPSPPIVIYKKAQHRSLDDLRWYCLARKFSILWQKSTFGCHLRRIKSFYHEKLLRQYFLLWKETIDEEKNQEQATEYYHQQLLRRTFHNWWTVIVQKRQESHLALEHLHRKRLQTTWQLWKTQFAKRRLRQRQFNMANEQYHRGVIGRFYHRWQTNTSQRQHEREKTLRASYHRRIHMQRICFQAWVTYTEYRRRKTTHKKRVQDYYQRRLLGRIYAQWKEALTSQLLIQQHEHRLAQLQERVLLRWAWEQWKYYMHALVDDQRAMEMAEQYSDRRIMRLAFDALRQYAIKRRVKQRMNWVAVKHRARTLEGVHFRAWKHRLEQRENILMYREFDKADAFFNMKITIRYWFYWRRYINDCRQEHAQLRAADKYHHLKLLKKYFTLLRANITDERREHWLEQRADEHYRMRYLRLYYTFWQVQGRMHERYRMNWRLAILHQETNMRQRYFNEWLDRAHLRLIDNEQHVVAERHYFRTLVVRVWSSWRHLIEEQHDEDRAERIAIQFYYHSIERRVLNAWKLYIRHCRYMKQMYREGDQFFVEHRGKSVFYLWLSKARYRRRMTNIVDERFQRIQRNALRYYFRQWRDRTQEDKDDRQLTQYALDHYHRALKRQVLLAWHQEMIQQMSLDNENQMKFNHYRAEKNHQQLREIYSRWKDITDQRRRERFLLRRAEVFFERGLLRKAFQQWKEQHQFDLRVHLLERQAIWFDRMRLIGRVFVQWKQNWQIEQRLNEQKQRALMFWALELQKRCFVTWLIYISERKRKKARYNEATHRRHDDLLRKSLRQFLVYTDHTRQRRQALFIHQQVYLYHDRNALAWKYLCKWRAFVKQAVAVRQQIPRPFKTSNPMPIKTDPLALVRFDNSPPKISNRPRPRKPAFLSESFSSPAINKRPTEIPISASPPAPPTIDHSLHSPFITVQQSPTIRGAPSFSPPLLLPPSAFQVNLNEIHMPLSSRPVLEKKVILPHRSQSTQPSSTSTPVDKDNLLHVKQRLEIYLNTKSKLKRLRQQLARSSPSEKNPQLEQECQQLSAFIVSEKRQLTDVLQTL